MRDSRASNRDGGSAKRRASRNAPRNAAQDGLLNWLLAETRRPALRQDGLPFQNQRAALIAQGARVPRGRRGCPGPPSQVNEGCPHRITAPWKRCLEETCSRPPRRCAARASRRRRCPTCRRRASRGGGARSSPAASPARPAGQRSRPPLRRSTRAARRAERKAFPVLRRAPSKRPPSQRRSNERRRSRRRVAKTTA